MAQQENNKKSLNEIAEILALAIVRKSRPGTINSLDFLDTGSVYATTEEKESHE